ncbi:MAG: catalase family protein [Methylococcales bacterium]
MLNKILPLSFALISSVPALASCNEEIPPNEAAAIQKIVQLLEESVRAEAKTELARRGAHAKAHGCVKAEFRILDKLPEEVRFGIFKSPRTYPAWIRYSNGAGKVQDDSVGDARGMAVKLKNVEHSKTGRLDLVMINHPVFFVRNAADYVEFQNALAEDSPVKFFFPGFNPFNFRLHEFGIVNAIKDKTVTNPLDTQYWSTTPYRLGNTAMKFSARPCTTASKYNDTTTPNFLRDNMQKQLIPNEACFDFMVQLQRIPSAMPIEDPTLEWREEDSPFIRVAQITIPIQTFSTPEQLAFCENLSFTPWNTIPEHQPLGGINRVRKTVYEAISRIRHELNNQPTRF